MSYNQTPTKIISEIQNHITGKIVCDLGCGTGDFLEAMLGHAASVIGVEQITEQANIAIAQGLTVENRNFLQGDFPDADVYYSYQPDVVLGQLLEKIINEDIKGIFLIAVSGSTLANLAMNSLTGMKIDACNGYFVLYVWNRN